MLILLIIIVNAVAAALFTLRLATLPDEITASYAGVGFFLLSCITSYVISIVSKIPQVSP